MSEVERKDDPAASREATRVVEQIGRVEALQLLALLELPDVDRHRLMSTMFVEDDGRTLAELVARIEEDESGRTKEGMIRGLHGVLEGDGPV